MRMFVHSGNSMRELEEFVNENHIEKEQIFSMIQDRDGVWMLVYYAEER